ncbi:MAG: tetratricopeptide repeat protein, partial [Pseudomonadota bacterium]
SIRRALNDDASAPKFVETIPRYGYLFLQKPEFLDAPPNEPESGLRLINRHFKIAASLALVVILCAVFFVFTKPQSGAGHSVSTENYVASPGYADFLYGRYALSRGDFEQAEERLKSAVKSDPSLAPAYISLARIHVANRRSSWLKIVNAQELADRAIEIDNDLAAGHALKAGLALYYLRDHVLARDHIQKALALAPNDPDVLVVDAYLNIIQGDENGALEAIGRAHEIRPLSTNLNADYGWILYKAGSWNDAERLCKTSIDLNPRSAFALDCVIHVNHSQGDYAEAAEYGLQLMALRNATKEDVDTVRQIADPRMRERAYWDWTLEWIENNAADINDPFSKRAITLTMLGRYDEAVEVFNRAYEKNGEPFLAFLGVDPRVDELRSHTHFKMLASQSQVPAMIN